MKYNNGGAKFAFFGYDDFKLIQAVYSIKKDGIKEIEATSIKSEKQGKKEK